MRNYLKLVLFLPIFMGSSFQIEAVAKRVFLKAPEIEEKITTFALVADGDVSAGTTATIYNNRLKNLGLSFSQRVRGIAGFEQACDQSINQILQILNSPEFSRAYALRFMGKTQGKVGHIDMCREMILSAERPAVPANRIHLIIAKMAFLDFLCFVLDAVQIQFSKATGWAAKKGLYDYQNGPDQIFEGFRQRDLNETRNVLNRDCQSRSKYFSQCGLVSTFLFRNGPVDGRGRYVFLDDELAEIFSRIITQRTSMAKAKPSPTRVALPVSLPNVQSFQNIGSPSSSRLSPGLSSTPRSNRSRSASLPRTPQSFSSQPRMARPSSAPQLASATQSYRTMAQRRSASVGRRPIGPDLLPSTPFVRGSYSQSRGSDIDSLRARLNRLNEEAQLSGELGPLQNRVAQLRNQLEIPNSPVTPQGQGSFDGRSDFEKEFDRAHGKFSNLPPAASMRFSQPSSAQGSSSSSRAVPQKKGWFDGVAKKLNPAGLWAQSAQPSVQKALVAPTIQIPSSIAASTPLRPPSPRTSSPRPAQKPPLSQRDKIVQEENRAAAAKRAERIWSAQHLDPAITRTYESVSRNAQPVDTIRFDENSAVYTSGVPARAFKIFAPQNLLLQNIIVKRDEILFPASAPGIESRVKITENVDGFTPVINFDLSSGRYFALFTDGQYSSSMDKVDVEGRQFYKISIDVLFNLYRTIVR